MATPEPITIHVGTRRSALALKQVDMVTEWLQKAHPHLRVEVHAVSVAGDRDKTTPLPALGKGLWTTELESQLLSKELDVIVHCLKDMPTSLPEGCTIGAVAAREDPRDVAIFKDQQKHSKLADLPAGSIVGTSSVRRAAQLRRKYPGLVFKDVRGNIDTRLKKLETEDYDCIILAAAGMLRMGFDARIGQYLDADNGTLYAVGQGALALEARKDDDKILGVLQSIVDQPTMLATYAERSVMRTLEGGCSVPIGVETSWVESESGPKKLRLRAMVISLDGTNAIETERTEEVAALLQADNFGRKVAQDLIDKGARTILDVINQGRENNPAAVKVGDV
ncbi:porphobilinogen deaminase [Thozetella sp. PMI_491]|nr:porphobilinogen deaminase [Thozetella sp. PMI_491]